MVFPRKNPFGLVKATFYSDQEIADRFVDLPDEGGFNRLLDPGHTMPQFILGGKGSGRTHLMRWLGWDAQRLAAKPAQEFVGIYIFCSALSLDRFATLAAANTSRISRHFLDLWIAERMLQVTSTFCNDSEGGDVALRTVDVAALFDGPIDLPESPTVSLPQVLTIVTALRRQLDFVVNNRDRGHPLPDILSTDSRLIFDLASLLVRDTPQLAARRLVLLLDEFENLDEPTQAYVQTLVRETHGPVGIIVGARNYGVRTWKTIAGEVNRVTSEYRQVELDANWLTDHAAYRRFCTSLIADRLRRIDPEDSTPSAPAQAMFERVPPVRADSELVELRTKAGRWSPTLRSLLSRLNENLIHIEPLGIAADEVESVALRLASSNALVERLNVFLFYRAWSQGLKLHFAIDDIVAEHDHYMSGNDGTVFGDGRPGYAAILRHRRSDLEAQTLRDYRRPVRYSGFGTIVRTSGGNPRHLLGILGQIWEEGGYWSEDYFANLPIAMSVQSAAAYSASDGFWRDLESNPQLDEATQGALRRFAEMLRELRYADKPPEAAPCGFLVDPATLDASARSIIDICVDWRFLIRSDRQAKNSPQLLWMLQLNPMLAPRMGLSVNRRGASKLTDRQVRAIFLGDDFELTKRDRLTELQAPFSASRRARRPMQQQQLPST